MIDLNNYKNVHFIGIGGVSMSGLAEILKSKGMHVRGSDNKASSLTEHLKSIGIDILIGQSYENIADNCDLVVYTAAVKEDNPEMVSARDKNIKIIDRAELLGVIMDCYKKSVAVSGTHGKTTTTTMISKILLEAEKDPTINVGGIFKAIGSNFRVGNSDFFVAESCEYFDSFLKFFPYVGIILNIDKDHTDYFKTMEQMEASFNHFAKNISKDGCLVINTGIKNFDSIIDNVECQIITYGITEGDYQAKNIIFSEDGKPAFDIYYKDSFIKSINLDVTGLHNVENSLASFAACTFLGLSPEEIAIGLENFEGAKRRFEFKGSFNGITIIDDYAHHPTEIAATLSAAKKFKHNKIYCIFQPHTYSRTKALLDRFAGAFEDADAVIVTDIYSARETDTLGIHSMNLVEEIRKTGKEVYYFSSFKEAEDFLLEKSVPNDMLITMGAGDVYLLGESLLLTGLSTLSTEN